MVARVWRYVALGASSLVLEEATPIWGGIRSRHGQHDFLAVIVAITLVMWAASLALYCLGYWRIEWVRHRFPTKQRLLDAALRIVQRHPWRASLAIRFAYWLRVPLPIACGAARVPVMVYVVASAISCITWTLAFVSLGYWASRPALLALSYAERGDVRLGLVGLVLLIALFIMLRRRRRLAEGTAHVLSGEDIPIETTAERETPILPMRRVRDERGPRR